MQQESDYAAIFDQGNGQDPNADIADSPHNLPVNHEAEAWLLGAVLNNNRALDRLPEDFQAGHFADPRNRTVFEAIRRYVEAGRTANPVTLQNAYADSPEFDDLGGWTQWRTVL